MTEITEDDLLACLAAEVMTELLRPNDVTAERLAEAANIDKYRAHDILKRKAKRGELVEVTCTNPDTKRPITAYRRPGKV